MFFIMPTFFLRVFESPYITMTVFICSMDLPVAVPPAEILDFVWRQSCIYNNPPAG